MTRLLLILLLFLSSGPVYAEWVAVGSSESAGGYTGYIDPDTIRRKGDLVKVWELYDFKTAQTVVGVSFLSRQWQRQYDCVEERGRGLATTEFSGNMGNGNVVWTDSDEGKWSPVAPESIGKALWKFACGKK